MYVEIILTAILSVGTGFGLLFLKSVFSMNREIGEMKSSTDAVQQAFLDHTKAEERLVDGVRSEVRSTNAKLDKIAEHRAEQMTEIRERLAALEGSQGGK